MMDLISTLAGQVGINEDQAQGLAGVLLSGVKQATGDKEASAINKAIPELSDWQSKAISLMGNDDNNDEGGLMDSLAGFAGSGAGQALMGAIGGQEAQQKAQLVSMISKLGIDSDKAMMAAPFVLNFLKDRVDADIIDKVLDVAGPLLGGDKGSAASSIMGAVGGLFGKN